jgi:hypothetical protein
MASKKEVQKILGGLIKRIDENEMKKKGMSIKKTITKKTTQVEIEKKDPVEIENKDPCTEGASDRRSQSAQDPVEIENKNQVIPPLLLLTIAVNQQDVVNSIAPRMIVDNDGKKATLIMYVERNPEDDMMMEGDEYNAVNAYAESEGHYMENARFWYYWDNYFEETMRDAMVGFMDSEKWKRDRKALGDTRNVYFNTRKPHEKLENILYTEHTIPLKLKKN